MFEVGKYTINTGSQSAHGMQDCCSFPGNGFSGEEERREIIHKYFTQTFTNPQPGVCTHGKLEWLPLMGCWKCLHRVETSRFLNLWLSLLPSCFILISWFWPPCPWKLSFSMFPVGSFRSWKVTLSSPQRFSSPGEQSQLP